VNQGWVTNVHSWSTSVVLGADKWRIESGMPLNATDSWFCDGTNVFRSIHFRPVNPNENSSVITASNNGPNENVLVIPGTHPMGDFGVNLAWLAYCSGGYLQSPNRILPLLGGEPRHQLEVFAVEDKTVLSESPPFLPSKIEFLANLTNAAKAAQSQFVFRTAGSRSIPVMEPDGTLLATYQVEQFTNYSGWTIPAVFSYFQTNRVAGLQGSGMRYFNTGKVTNITVAPAPRAILEEGKRAFIEDTRFRHPDRLVDSMRYWLTNGALPATNDPEMLATLERISKTHPLVGK